MRERSPEPRRPVLPVTGPRGAFAAAAAAAALLGCGAEVAPEDEGDGPGAAASGASGAGGVGGAGGAGANGSRDGGGAPEPTGSVSSPVLLSEIMYHPVLENDVVDRHEFIELWNRTAAPIALKGWRLEGTIRFAFPDGSVIGPRQYLVVAKDRKALAAVAVYGLRAEQLQGDYENQLDNGGGRVALVDASGAVADVVKYDDEFPWPLGPDALGVGESWLPERDRPLTKHQYLGHSLERVSFEVPAGEIANWVASPLDGPTPGKANTGAGTPLPVVESLAASPAGAAAAMGLIRAEHEVRVRVRFSARGAVQDPAVEYFVDDLVATNEPRVRAPLKAAGDGLEAALPPQKAGSIVRYRIVGNRGQGAGVISPRPSDPLAWYGYFVTPDLPGESPTYQLFIAPVDWTRMWQNIVPGMVPAGQCAPNPAWNARVPATFVAADGRVFDVQVRYHGGYIHRREGGTLRAWTAPGPAAPSPVLALGLKVKFPRYRAFDGRKSVIFNKLRQSCPGVDSFITTRLEKAIGLPAPDVRFVRVFINGAYFNYMMELDDVDEDLLSRFHGKDEPVGDLWKSNGTFGVVGPYGPGDESLLGAACGYMPADRYRATYKRRSLDWKGPEELMAMLDKLHAARRAGLPALRTFLAETFDIEKLLSHVAMMNWAGAWDDAIHNHFLYKRPDGRWVIAAWDYDQLYGGGAVIDVNTPQNAMVSFYHGLEGDPNNKLGWNVIKDSVLRAYRAEFDKRLVDMSKTLLAPANVIALADEGEKALSYSDWMATPARPACDVRARIETIRRWARDRDAVLAARYGR